MSTIQRRPPLPTSSLSSTMSSSSTKPARIFSASTRMTKRRSFYIIIIPLLFFLLSFCVLIYRLFLPSSNYHLPFTHDPSSINDTIPPLNKLTDADLSQTPSSIPETQVLLPTSVAIFTNLNTQTNHILDTINSVNKYFPNLPITVFLPLSKSHSLPTSIHTKLISARPYSNPLQLLANSQSPVLYIRAGTIISPNAPTWLQSVTKAYASRTDIAAFSLDTIIPKTKVSSDSNLADHDPKSWTTVSDIPSPESSSAIFYTLAPSLNAFMLRDMPPHISVFKTFREWLLLRRFDWFRYPTGAGVDQTPLGMSAILSHHWTRASWNVWFTAFLHEYELSVVYPNLPPQFNLISTSNTTSIVNDNQKQLTFKFPTTILPYDGSGKLIKSSFFNFATIDHIVRLGKQQNGMISFTMVNKVFLETAKSWVCNVDVAGFRPNGLLWAVTDKETETEMKSISNSHTVMLQEVTGGKETGNEFGNPGYWRLMLERTALIGEILKRGIAVFAFETDAIWLANPQPYIDQLVSQDADIVGTINTKGEVSGNFFYLRPTLATRRLWNEITYRFEKAYKNAHFERKSATSWTYIENDQSLLTNLVLKNEIWKRSYPLSFLTLDMELFVDGRWYKPDEGYYKSERARHPVVINNNFIIGVDKKTKRAKEWGHWFWDENKKVCIEDVVKKAMTTGPSDTNNMSMVS